MGAAVNPSPIDQAMYLKTSSALNPGMGLKSPKGGIMASQSAMNLLHPNFEQPHTPAHLARRSFESPANSNYGMQTSPPTQLPPHQFQNAVGNHHARPTMEYRNPRYMPSPKYPMSGPHSMHGNAGFPAAQHQPGHMMNKFNNRPTQRSPQHPPQSQMAMGHSHAGLLPKNADTYRGDDSMYNNSVWDHQQHKTMPNAYQQPQQSSQFKMKSPTSGYPPMFPNGHEQSRRPFGNPPGHGSSIPNLPQRRHDMNHFGNDSMNNFGAAAMNDGNFMIPNADKNDNRIGNTNDSNNNVNDENNKDDNKNHFHQDSSRFGNSNSYFIRSDSILTDDDFIPFDTPTQSKCGPISRKSAATMSPYLGQLKEQSKRFPCADSFCADIASFGIPATSHNMLDPSVSIRSPSMSLSSSSLWQYTSSPFSTGKCCA